MTLLPLGSKANSHTVTLTTNNPLAAFGKAGFSCCQHHLGLSIYPAEHSSYPASGSRLDRAQTQVNPPVLINACICSCNDSLVIFERRRARLGPLADLGLDIQYRQRIDDFYGFQAHGY